MVKPELSSFHQRVTGAGEEILGFKERKKEHWTWDKIIEREQTKEKITQYDQRK